MYSTLHIALRTYDESFHIQYCTLLYHQKLDLVTVLYQKVYVVADTMQSNTMQSNIVVQYICTYCTTIQFTAYSK